MTFGNSMPINSREMVCRDLMSCVADFLARTSASPAKEPGSTESDPVSGSKCSASSAKPARVSSSLKMSRPFALADWIPASGASLRSGMMRSGTVFPLPPLALPTGGIASGSWPTPDASVAQLGEKPDTWLARRERVKETAKNGNGMGMPLTIAVQLWPTPHANCRTGAGQSPGKQGGINLQTAVQTFATPTARDWRSGKASEATHARNSRPLSEQIGGQLSPTWVEGLMGYPAGWTDTSDEA